MSDSKSITDLVAWWKIIGWYEEDAEIDMDETPAGPVESPHVGAFLPEGSAARVAALANALTK